MEVKLSHRARGAIKHVKELKDLQMKMKEPAIVHTFSVINLMFPDDINVS